MNRNLKITPMTRYDELPELLTPKESCAFTGLSRNALYSAIRTRKLPTIRIGRTFYIPRACFERPAHEAQRRCEVQEVER